MKNYFNFWQRVILKLGELEESNISIIAKELKASYSYTKKTIDWLKEKKFINVIKLRGEAVLSFTPKGQKLFFKLFDVKNIFDGV